MKAEESIECPYCDGRGWDAEHDENCQGDCINCPIQIPCGYCYGAGRITTKLIKEHIAERAADELMNKFNPDDLPF